MKKNLGIFFLFFFVLTEKVVSSENYNQYFELLDLNILKWKSWIIVSNITLDNKSQLCKTLYQYQLIYLFDIFRRIVLIDHYLFVTLVEYYH